MNGPDCPVHGTPMDWLSTLNEWEYYCRECDMRYNARMKRMDASPQWWGEPPAPPPHRSNLRDEPSR